jgi:hypothetical protein
MLGEKKSRIHTNATGSDDGHPRAYRYLAGQHIHIAYHCLRIGL